MAIEQCTCVQNSSAVVQQLGSWDYLGCYSDGYGGYGNRILNGSSLYGSDETAVTVASCAEWCSQDGYRYFGVEWGEQCWCGNALNPGTANTPSPQANCNCTCCDDASTLCGGWWSINVYEADNSTLTSPANMTSANSSNSSRITQPTSTQPVNLSYSSGSGFSGANGHTPTQSNNATNSGSNNSRLSNSISLGVGLGLGIPMFILAALTFVLKISNKRKHKSQPGEKTEVQQHEKPPVYA